MSEPDRCFGLKPDGSRCEVTTQLCPTCAKCLWHCEHRVEQAAAARAKGGDTTARRTTKIRTVPLDQVPRLESMDDAVFASAWIFRLAASGGLDPSSAREANRAITTFVHATDKADLLKRIKVLEQKVRAYETHTVTGDRA
jgi:hypothetical protein